MKRHLHPKRLLLVIVVLLVIIFGLLFLLKQALVNPLTKLGYDDKTIALIEKLTPENQALIKSHNYDKRLFDLLTNQDFDASKLETYQKLMAESDLSAADIIKCTKLNLDLATYEKILKDPFAKDPYYILKNAKRYQAYAQSQNYQQLNDKEIRDVVECVNTKCDIPQYTQMQETDISKGDLMLVNKHYYLPSDYVPENLVDIAPEYGRFTICKHVYDALVKMCEDARKDGITFYGVSPYRSYQSQYSLYNYYKDIDGQAKADTYSARAGSSEHQTGLVVDLALSDGVLENLCDTKAYNWLNENAYRYGFIQHYKGSKVKYTMYEAECWHFRYVGLDVAKYLQEHDITFDEYYAYFVEK